MRKTLVLALAFLALVAACRNGDEERTAAVRRAGAQANQTDLSTILKDPGTLTVGAEPPAPPFIIPPYPDHPTGFEVDVAEEIGKRLGLETKWIEFGWTNLFSPAPKPFDFDINETLITDEGEETVDFSIPYFKANQAAIARRGTDGENARTLGDVKDLLIGAQEATSGLAYVRTNIKPARKERVFPTSAAANQALLSERIDAFVIDLPIAARLVAENPEELIIVGQFGTNVNWGIVFEEGSLLREHVDRVLQEMIEDGTLKRLQEKWLPGTTDIPIIE